VDELMPMGWQIAADLDTAGLSITRDRLQAAMRDAGQPISNGRAGALVARLKTEAPAHPTENPTPAVPAIASAGGSED
jgi:hypothetical protein